MILLLDNYDSFTYNLKDYLEQGGARVKVVRNDDDYLRTVDLSEFKGLVISPGPGRPDQAGYTLSIIERAIGKLPMLGVCLGMQAIGQFFGCSIERADYPMHGKVTHLNIADHPLFEGVSDKLEVCRYHSLVVTNTEVSPLKVIATSPLNEAMAIAHPEHAIWGVQFHPEAILTPGGKQMIYNWIKSLNLQ